jgi:hypothetical protein
MAIEWPLAPCQGRHRMLRFCRGSIEPWRWPRVAAGRERLRYQRIEYLCKRLAALAGNPDRDSLAVLKRKCLKILAQILPTPDPVRTHRS